ncbi:Rrf2 family transcriptional regulator [Lysinibacillus odysseyi]|uniref:HTH-type transcriptional regulator NsrR n=1 Tax=Lysinibacillus odysseyi 34hs-1 = NBRC 100172 TaxID=1220589 RepID=A0A0A3JCV4_9BACI|nr:Rrf2 family transcriptional regulator [Lysinibacillus odysseyi]KGR84837.1 hypothetical protein CD32_10265 [Lysinibacillus odysseyi 34hs-1 = NBRC 100172]
MQLLIQSGDLGPKWFHVALRTLTMLAVSEELVKSHHIAENLGEDPTYIRKIVARLVKNGMVSAIGGRYGGYRLQKNANAISVKDVYIALSDYSVTPFYVVPSTGVEYSISQIISKAEQVFQSSLDQYSIQDILDTKKD